MKEAPVVQWIERQIPVLNVGGSSPFGRTTSEQALYRLLRLFYKSQSALTPLLILSKSQPLRWVVIWDRRSAAFFDFAEISVLTVICIKITRPFGVVIFMVDLGKPNTNLMCFAGGMAFQYFFNDGRRAKPA